ncbi:tetratricopeptide repeat protein [Geobacter anodireducens]|uniref:Tetratricopeptide repeat protein n=3 Tax=Geobacter TaxID=28231 RepID=A0A0C1TT26_9BACT|nr:hypothetical protein [Geobacter soli]ANA40486.1 hypothetical protein A2G06_09495 [Geobacter anodireducens]KIE42513.1 hypothetical protein SE37_07680 [Geobacter soli]
MNKTSPKFIVILLVFCLLCYGLLLQPFTDYLHKKPFVERLGYTPNADLLKAVVADQKESVAAALIFKVIVYYGTLVEKARGKIELPADYRAMSRTIHSGVKLDPYNMDGYYFAQAILAWDVGKIDVANALLDYGMKFRNWDFQLPYFAGFNCAYFQEDYANAAKYFQRAAELSGNDLFVSLTGRYLQESGQTNLAIDYLAAMAKEARNPDIRNSFQLRLEAFRQVLKVEQARDGFVAVNGRLPVSIDELLVTGFLVSLPQDPYGGTFFLEADGKIRTTSKFALKRTPTSSGE